MSAKRMEKGAPPQAGMESPCVNICVIHPDNGLCVGCYRTGDEIAAWAGMTPAERRAVMAELPARKAEFSRRRRGRAARRRGVE